MEIGHRIGFERLYRPQNAPNYSCTNQNTCSNDNPDVNDMKENYMNYTPGFCQNAFTQGQKERAQTSLETLRPEIWSYANILATGCDSLYSAPSTCPVVADFVALNTDLCTGNSVYFMDKSLNNATSWLWTFIGGTPSSSTNQNPTVSYPNNGLFKVSVTMPVIFTLTISFAHLSPNSIQLLLYNSSRFLYPPSISYKYPSLNKSSFVYLPDLILSINSSFKEIVEPFLPKEYTVL